MNYSYHPTRGDLAWQPFITRGLPYCGNFTPLDHSYELNPKYYTLGSSSSNTTQWALTGSEQFKLHVGHSTTPSSTSSVQNYENIWSPSFEYEKRRVGKPRKQISKQQISELLHLEQQEAAKQLNVSVSTLKRRFQEFFHTSARWPAPNHRERIVNERERARKLSLHYIVLKLGDTENCKDLDEQTLVELDKAFRTSRWMVPVSIEQSKWRLFFHVQL